MKIKWETTARKGPIGSDQAEPGHSSIASRTLRSLPEFLINP